MIQPKCYFLKINIYKNSLYYLKNFLQQSFRGVRWSYTFLLLKVDGLCFICKEKVRIRWFCNSYWYRSLVLTSIKQNDGLQESLEKHCWKFMLFDKKTIHMKVLSQLRKEHHLMVRHKRQKHNTCDQVLGNLILNMTAYSVQMP